VRRSRPIHSVSSEKQSRQRIGAVRTVEFVDSLYRARRRHFENSPASGVIRIAAGGLCTPAKSGPEEIPLIPWTGAIYQGWAPSVQLKLARVVKVWAGAAITAARSKNQTPFAFRQGHMLDPPCYRLYARPAFLRKKVVPGGRNQFLGAIAQPRRAAYSGMVHICSRMV
jgi:hypothetical protein